MDYINEIIVNDLFCYSVGGVVYPCVVLVLCVWHWRV